MTFYVDAGTFSYKIAYLAQEQGMKMAQTICDDFMETSKPIICLDSDFSIRKEQYPWYKANRKDPFPAIVRLTKNAKQWVKWAIKRYHGSVKFLEQKGYEADDLIGYYAMPGMDNVLSEDKDLLQLVNMAGEGLRLFNFKMQQWGIEKLQKRTKEYTLTVGERALAYQLCHGDVADNIPRSLSSRDRRTAIWAFQLPNPLVALCSGGPIPIIQLRELLNCLVVPSPLLFSGMDPIEYVHSYYRIVPVKSMDWEDEVKESQSWRQNMKSR